MNDNVSGFEEMMKNMKYNNKWKKAGAAVMAAALLGNSALISGSGLLTACAAGAETPLGSYTEAQMLCFGDNVLEYWEIQGLVEHYNPSYLKQLDIFYSNPMGGTGMMDMTDLSVYEESLEGLKGLSKDQLLLLALNLRQEANELKVEAEDQKNKISEESYQEYTDNIKELKRLAQKAEKAANGTTETKRALRIVRNQEVISVSAQMREYQNLLAQDQIQAKNQELAELSYQSSERQYGLGMISAEALLAAQDSLNAVRSARDASAASLLQKKHQLITALGWAYDGNPEIRTIPEPDLNLIAAYDLTADTALAVGANYDVYDLRKKDKSEFNGTQDKLRQIREKEDQVRMQMEYLYSDVQQKMLTYQSAQEGWTAADAKLSQAERKFHLGMISKAEFLAEEIAWMTAKASKEQAALSLLAAMENYEWAVKGLMKL